MYYLGRDQHHRQITISLRNEEGTVIQRRQVSTQLEKTRAFLNELRRQSGEEGFMAILEVCGFNDWLSRRVRLPGDCADSSGQTMETEDRPPRRGQTRRTVVAQR